MKIAVWKTGHEIADTVAEAVYEGLKPYAECKRYNTGTDTRKQIQEDVVIAYGILRGTSDIFRMAQAMGKPFVCIDRGYWKPGHYDGYYRISLNGTQQTTGLDKLEPDYERLDKLGLDIFDRPAMGYERESGAHNLVCPPTDHVAKFFGVDQYAWPIMNAGNTPDYIFRHKGSEEPIDWRKVRKVITFNSSVGWEALRQGIPVTSDPNHSILGAYQKQVDTMTHMDIDSRRRFFAIQAGLQLTLEEIRSGLIWPLINRLRFTSDTMIANQ